MPGLPPEPTSEQCSNHEIIEFEDQKYLAIWYPQMGGYVGHCLVSLEDTENREPDRCFEAIIWHDGEFPIGSRDSPSFIHHCQAQQFINFGVAVQQALANTVPR